MLQRAWKKLDFNPTTIMIMVKPAIAATIAMAIFQSHAVANHYLNLGYLIIIVSITTVPILPRGKFIMNLLISVLLTCFGCGMVTLGQWCGIKARQHTTPADASLAVANGYNSSASVVNAIFFMVNIFGISVLRAARPAFSIPGIQYTVFVCVGFSYGPQEPTVTASHRFIRELLYSFLTGQAISAGVCLFIIPVSSRKVFFAEAAGFLQACRGLLKAQMGFVRVLEHSRLCNPLVRKEHLETEEGKALLQTFTQRAKALKAASAGILGLGAKLRDDVVFARRESAYGHFRETDISELHQLLRRIMIPISGLSTIVAISEGMQEDGKLPDYVPEGISDDEFNNERKEWLDMIGAVMITFEQMVQTLDESILHILILLRFIPGAPKKASKLQREDVENKGDSPQPGHLGYGDYLEKRIKDFRKTRTAELKAWATSRGLNSVFQSTLKKNSVPSTMSNDKLPSGAQARDILASKRLHIIMFMEYLLWTTSLAILSLVRFAELKSTDNTFKHSRFIFPKIKTLIKWVKGLINGDPDSSPNFSNLDENVEPSETIYLGSSFNAPKDPEHLPPKNAIQRLGNHLRLVPKFLGSEPVRFGVRVTIATMSIGIMAYLHSTHKFFIQQRAVWCLVMIAIGMSPTSGSAVFNMLGNLTFTLFGMIGAFINWYIVDQKTTGVIVIFFFFIMFYFYFCAKYPRFLVAIVAGALTHVLVIGYELQVRVIGLAQATATGQPYYPLYELAPYRLLTVGAGVLVGYIFTIFPVPITEASILRRDLGLSLFLLSKYLSAVTATVDMRLQDKSGDMKVKSSPGRRLEKMRHKVLEKQVMLLGSMRANLGFLPWDLKFGGEFPTELYKALVDEVQEITNYLTIIAYATESFPSSHSPSITTSPTTLINQTPWLTRFSHYRQITAPQSHHLTTLLTLLSASLRNAQPLPPYLIPPTPYRISDELLDEGTELLELSNLDEPGFRAVAVVETGQRCVVRSVGRCVERVRDIVGEVDFSFRVVGTNREEGMVFGGPVPGVVSDDDVGADGKVKNA